MLWCRSNSLNVVFLKAENTTQTFCPSSADLLSDYKVSLWPLTCSADWLVWGPQPLVLVALRLGGGDEEKDEVPWQLSCTCWRVKARKGHLTCSSCRACRRSGLSLWKSWIIWRRSFGILWNPWHKEYSLKYQKLKLIIHWIVEPNGSLKTEPFDIEISQIQWIYNKGHKTFGTARTKTWDTKLDVLFESCFFFLENLLSQFLQFKNVEPINTS